MAKIKDVVNDPFEVFEDEASAAAAVLPALNDYDAPRFSLRLGAERIKDNQNLRFWGMWFLVEVIKFKCALLQLNCYLDDVMTPFNSNPRMVGFDAAKTERYVRAIMKSAFKKAAQLRDGEINDDGTDPVALTQFAQCLRKVLKDDHRALGAWQADDIVLTAALLTKSNPETLRKEWAAKAHELEADNHASLVDEARAQGIVDPYTAFNQDLQYELEAVVAIRNEKYAEYKTRRGY